MSTNRLLLGSNKVIFEDAGELVIIKDSPSLIAVGTLGLSLILIFKLSLKVNLYSKDWSTPASSFISKESFCPVIPLKFSLLLLIMLSYLVPSESVIVGFPGKVKSILPRPLDSTEFKIPSLSRSKSRLSIIPSLSWSVGHVNIGMDAEKYSTVSESQLIIPFTL